MRVGCEGVVLTLVDVTERRRAELETAAALERNAQLVGELREALQNVRTLTGLLPICAYCKRIRNDDAGYWQRIEEYVSTHTDALFTHGICPQCAREHLSEYSG